MLVELKPSHFSEKELGGHGRLFSKLNEGYIRMYLRLACPGLFVTLWRAQRPHEKSGKPRPLRVDQLPYVPDDGPAASCGFFVRGRLGRLDGQKPVEQEMVCLRSHSLLSCGELRDYGHCGCVCVLECLGLLA